jgi:hypothetical protein
VTESPRRGGGGSNSRSNPNWQARRLEPGAISILKEKAPTANPVQTAAPPVQIEIEQVATPEKKGQQRFREKNVKVMYAPKQKQEQTKPQPQV